MPDTLGLLRGAFRAFLGHCAPEIAKTTTYLVSELDLVQNRVFPPTAQPILRYFDPMGPKGGTDQKLAVLLGEKHGLGPSQVY